MSDMKIIQLECPDILANSLDQLVQEGWLSSPTEGFLEALRRYLDSHRPELLTKQIEADVEWGLHGND